MRNHISPVSTYTSSGKVKQKEPNKMTVNKNMDHKKHCKQKTGLFNQGVNLFQDDAF